MQTNMLKAGNGVYEIKGSQRTQKKNRSGIIERQTKQAAKITAAIAVL